MREPHYRTSFRVAPRFDKRDDAAGLCRRCGLKGQHMNWEDCIRALRDLVAEREIEIIRLQPVRPYRRDHAG
jgi:hypothetical protein